MAKELPFFQFDISEWMLGRIQKQPLEVQGVFINLCCRYWHKLGELTTVDARLDFDDESIDLLLKKEIIHSDGEYIYIKFLDEQLDKCQELKKKNSLNGLKSAKARADRKRSSTTVEPPLKVVERISTEENRREEKREREIIQEVATILKYTSPNTSALTYMVRQWMAEVPDIPERLKAMKAYYARQGLVFPTRINTLTESFPQANWIEKLQELDPERAAENFQKTLKDAKHQQQPDLIGSSKPGSLG
jgi:hypothetical protein